MDEVKLRTMSVRAWRLSSEVAAQLHILTVSELRARYGRGRWQLIKWLIDPFALVGVYLLMIRFIFYRSPKASGLILACSVIPFQLLTMTVMNSLTSIQVRRSIIANMRFRRALLPVSTALTETIGFGASLTLLAMMMAIYGIAPGWDVLWLPVVLAVTILLGIAVAYPVTLLGIWMPDLRGLIMSAMRTTYYLAPGLVALQAIHGRTNDWVRANPLTGLFEALRHAVLYQSSPPAWQLLYPLGFAAVISAVFVPIYLREQRQFAKVLE
jgi:lipopolysaccharide transport system permease protein/teichoic acid transport system permease protein